MSTVPGNAAVVPTELATTARVVVGVDGTAHSLTALKWAVYEAVRRQCPLHVVTCGEVPVVSEAGGLGSAVFTNTYLDAMEQYLLSVNATAVGKASAAAHGLTVTGETVLGSPAFALSGMTTATDVLVVGATNHPGRMTDLLGSVASVATHRAKGPTVVVRGDVASGTGLNRIVVGVDGSPDSLRALRWGAAEARLAHAELAVVHAWSDPYAASEMGLGDTRGAALRAAQQVIDDAMRVVAEAEPGVTATPLLVEGHPAKAVIDAAGPSHLLVVGSRGRGGFRALLLGSVSRTVLEHAACSVAVVPHD